MSLGSRQRHWPNRGFVIQCGFLLRLKQFLQLYSLRVNLRPPLLRRGSSPEPSFPRTRVSTTSTAAFGHGFRSLWLISLSLIPLSSFLRAPRSSSARRRRPPVACRRRSPSSSSAPATLGEASPPLFSPFSPLSAAPPLQVARCRLRPPPPRVPPVAAVVGRMRRRQRVRARV